MQISVLGATGGTGQEILRQGLEKGYQMVAMARNPLDITITHQNLRVLPGNVFDPASLEPVVAGSEVVVSSVGIANIWKARRPNAIYSKGTNHLIQAMQKSGLKRLIAVSSGGVEDSPGEPWFFRYLLKPIFLNNMYADMRLMESAVRQSGLTWTLVRPPYLTNGALKKQYRLSRGKNIPDDKDLSRADLAHFIVEEIEKKDFLNEVVAISY